jgi:hypothetical protein
LPSRAEVIERYRRLREIGKRHHSEVLSFLSPDAVLDHARRLGLAHGRSFIHDSEDDLVMAFDLAIYTAPAGRSRAIDRYAGAARLAPGSDEALVLDAMREARFAILSVERRHESAGLVVTDLFRQTELWLVNEGLGRSLPNGDVLATRYYAPDRFAMTAGVIMPVDRRLLTRAIDSAPALSRKSPTEAIEDRRFARALYRAVRTGSRSRSPTRTLPAPRTRPDRLRTKVEAAEAARLVLAMGCATRVFSRSRG